MVHISFLLPKLEENNWWKLTKYPQNSQKLIFMNMSITLEQKPRKTIYLSGHTYCSIIHQIRRKLQIWSHLLKKSLMENFIFVQWYPWPLQFIRFKIHSDIVFVTASKKSVPVKMSNRKITVPYLTYLKLHQELEQKFC